MKTLEQLYDEVVPHVGHDKFMAALEHVNSLITELTALVIEANAWGDENNWPEVEYYPQYRRAREIGNEILNLAGFKGMQTSVGSVRKRLVVAGKGDVSLALLEYGWSDIGGWQP
jgi:hypothetical protein